MHLIGYKIPLFNNLGLTFGNFAPWYAWILMFVIGVLYIIYTFNAVPFVRKMQNEFSLFKLIGLLTIAGGILEEVVFRKWLMDLLQGLGFGLIIQVLISGIMFGLAHVIWSLFNPDKKFLIGAFFSTTFLGFALAVLYLIANRNVGPAIVAHSLINIVIEPWLLLSAVSGGWTLNKIK